ncbi:hypothetical protein QFZ72_000721 [Bacillus sp. V2I10]|nr:hypothetical protein [Bacillus sp. V2I10]
MEVSELIRKVWELIRKVRELTRKVSELIGKVLESESPGIILGNLRSHKNAPHKKIILLKAKMKN